MIGGFFTNRAAKVLAPRETPVGDRLPYTGHVDPVTLATTDGLLMQTLRLRGLPFETAGDDELNYRKSVRETLLRSIADARTVIYHHVIRRRVTPAFPEPPDTPFCRRLDERWQAQLSERRLYVNELFVTLARRPLPGGVGLLERLLRGGSQRDGDLQAELRQLRAAREAMEAALAPYGARTLGLYEGPTGLASEPAEFLSLLLNGEGRPVLAPTGRLGEALATRRLSFGLDALELSGDVAPSFAAMVALKDYPARSSPGILDGVLRLPTELVLTETFGYVDRQAGLDRMGLALRRLRAADDAAFSLRSELAHARDEAASGRLSFGEHHLTVLVRADGLDELDAAVAEVRSTLGEAGAICVREDVNLEPAFWAQFPGNLRFIARKSLISTANFASLASFHNQPNGRTDDLHWGAPVTLLETTSFGPYAFNFHAEDLGNFTVIGPSGSGKTVLLTFLLSSADRFRPQIAYFDKDRGAEPYIRAVGGRYEALSPGVPSGFNPLALPDTPANRAFLVEWLERLLAGDGAPLGPEERATVADAVDASYGQPARHRRLRYLNELFRGGRRPSAGDLAARLSAWCEGGEHAWLFDNEADELDLRQRVLGFDMTKLLDMPAVRTPAMMYLFHRVEQRLDGAPAIIVIDEGWKALDDEVFVRRVRDWEKTIRKRNGVVGFCTQNAGDALDSRIASAIIEQSATQIFFPNPKARASDYVDGFGLTEHEFELVRTLPDTLRCFLVKQADHSIVARLDLKDLEEELKVLAGDERSVRQLDRLRAQYGDAPEAWLEPFIRGQGAAA